MEYILHESQLGYTSDYFKVTTNAPISEIQALNILKHRASWVKMVDIESKLKENGFDVVVEAIQPTKHFIAYLKDDNFISLASGNY